MTEPDLLAAQAIVDGATPGPWETNDWRSYGVTAPNHPKDFTDESIHWWGGKFLAETESEADAQFIAFARTFVPAAIAEIRRLQGVEALALAVVNERRAKIMHARESSAMCKLARAVDDKEKR